MFTKFETIFYSNFLVIERCGEHVIIFENNEVKKIHIKTLSHNKFSCFDDLYTIAKSKNFNISDYVVRMIKGRVYEQ